jgi:hypothetical protein
LTVRFAVVSPAKTWIRTAVLGNTAPLAPSHY